MACRKCFLVAHGLSLSCIAQSWSKESRGEGNGTCTVIARISIQCNYETALVPGERRRCSLASFPGGWTSHSLKLRLLLEVASSGSRVELPCQRRLLSCISDNPGGAGHKNRLSLLTVMGSRRDCTCAGLDFLVQMHGELLIRVRRSMFWTWPIWYGWDRCHLTGSELIFLSNEGQSLRFHLLQHADPICEASMIVWTIW